MEAGRIGFWAWIRRVRSDPAALELLRWSAASAPRAAARALVRLASGSAGFFWGVLWRSAVSAVGFALAWALAAWTIAWIDSPEGGIRASMVEVRVPAPEEVPSGWLHRMSMEARDQSLSGRIASAREAGRPFVWFVGEKLAKDSAALRSALPSGDVADGSALGRLLSLGESGRRVELSAWDLALSLPRSILPFDLADPDRTAEAARAWHSKFVGATLALAVGYAVFLLALAVEGSRLARLGASGLAERFERRLESERPELERRVLMRSAKSKSGSAPPSL